MPSFIRLTSSSPSGSAITSTSAVPVAIETSANPSPVAATSPPRSRIATADTPHSIATERSVPVRGSNRWISWSSMSTHKSAWFSASHTGPSPSGARASSMSSQEMWSGAAIE